jgi:hypothetical protein
MGLFGDTLLDGSRDDLSSKAEDKAGFDDVVSRGQAGCSAL